MDAKPTFRPAAARTACALHKPSATAWNWPYLRVGGHFELVQNTIGEQLIANLAVQSVIDRVRVRPGPDAHSGRSAGAGIDLGIPQPKLTVRPRSRTRLECNARSVEHIPYGVKDMHIRPDR